MTIQSDLGLAPNTVEAYGRALEDYLVFTAQRMIVLETAGREHIAAYVRDLGSRPHPHRKNVVVIDSGLGLANATLQQRLTAVRLFYDYLMEEGVRQANPVGRGRYTPGRGFGGTRGLLPRYRKLPWIPNDEQWRAMVNAARSQSLRNRVMFAMAYDAGLRREELCLLETGDIDPAHRTLSIRAETTKNRQGRIVPYSGAASTLYAQYLSHRRELSRDRGRIFISESRRNRGQPISIWTWSKVVAEVARGAKVPQFTTHTFRHLCLTDLARAGWDIRQIATFAGHRSLQTTLLYIHLGGHELADKVEKGMAEIHAWRVNMLAEVLH
ncbi:MAG: tyrosine-type recombinase/integrase [Dokdonella sp.]